MDVVMEEVLIVDVQRWRGALRTSFNRTVGSKNLSNRKFLLSPVLSADRLSTFGWVLSLTWAVQLRIWVSLSLLLSLAVRLWFLPPAQTRLVAKRAEKSKFDRYPHINLVPFILETTGRPGPHARKFMNYLLRDADNPPIAVRETWAASKVSSTVPSPNNNLRQSLRDSWGLLSHFVSFVYIVLTNASPASPGTHIACFGLKPAAAVPCGPAVTSPRPTMTSTTLTAISSSCLRTLVLRSLCLKA